MCSIKCKELIVVQNKTVHKNKTTRLVLSDSLYCLHNLILVFILALNIWASRHRHFLFKRQQILNVQVNSVYSAYLLKLTREQIILTTQI